MSLGVDYQALVSASHPSPNVAIIYYRNKEYPREIWYFLASFVALVSLLRLSTLVYSHAISRAVDPEQRSSPLRHGLALRRIPLAIANVYRVIAFRWTIQLGESYTLNIAEVTLTVAYIIAIFGWEFTNTTDVAGKALDFNYWSLRAGAIAASQFPMVTALGTKNNIISLLTGVGHDKLNYLHRMMARVNIILLWVHGGSRIHNGIQQGLGEVWLRCGLLGITALSLLFLVSLRPIRSGAYEIFFYSHFLLVLIFLVGAYYHTRELTFGPYIWSSFIIWGFDRLLRIVRIVIFNNSFGSKSNLETLDATPELLSKHFIRLRLKRPGHFTWQPGQTAYLTMPGVSRFPLEAHPFTIGSLSTSSLKVTDADCPSTCSSTNEKAPVHCTPADWKELEFFINVCGGFTKQLAKAAAHGQTVKVLLDGPYGSSPDLTSFDTAVLIAGGAGISYTLPLLLHLINHAHHDTGRCHKILFIWSIRDAEQLHWISSTVSKALSSCPSNLNISIHLHVTGPYGVSPFSRTNNHPQNDPDKESLETTEEKRNILSFRGVSLFEKRPDLYAVLRNEVGNSSGRMGVIVCGSQAISRATRLALQFPVSNPVDIMHGGPSITLHVESFGYA